LTSPNGQPVTGRPDPPVLLVVGVDTLGNEVARLILGHGQDPTVLLAAHGWEARRTRDVTSHTVTTHVLTMTFEVEPARAVDPSLGGESTARFADEGATTRRDPDLVMAKDEVPELHQRVAAYALVTSSRGVLMTQFSDRTNAEGQWGLPGGGIKSGEPPELAVVREAWEESGQVIEVSDLAHIQTSHWIGRAPTGRLEDFHAVRVVYRAVCHEPTDPVVHDIGGTTASASWVPPTDLDRLDVTSGWRSLLSAVVGVALAPGQADGPDHREHDTDDDDRTRSQP
jgi:8-oxo-dGTP diphosphatase